MPKNTSQLLTALKKKQLHEAQVIFKQIMQGKAGRLIEREQRSLNEEVPAQPMKCLDCGKPLIGGYQPCRSCGSTKGMAPAPRTEEVEELNADDVSEARKKKSVKESFKSVENKIASKEGVSKKSAGAILAKSSRNASAAAKKKNPKLKRVKG